MIPRARPRLPAILPALLVLVAHGCSVGARTDRPEGPSGVQEEPAGAPEATYRIFVGAESADQLHLVRFGPGGLELERTWDIGRFPTEVEGPHGVALSPDRRFLFMTTGHGTPDGHFWKFDAESGALLAEPIPLGRFPATLDLTPDGLYAFVVNFNLHGSMVASTMSVVFTPEAVEVARIDLCTMPHGVRTHPRGSHVFTVCMMDDQLVEVDTRTFAVSRRFSVAQGREGPMAGPAAPAGEHAGHAVDQMMSMQPSCSPTWAHPSPDGSRVYVACNRSDEVLEIDLSEWTLRRRIATGRGPYNLDITTDGRLLVVTLKQGNAVEFFHTETGETAARTATSSTVVHGVTISPDDRFAFVSVEGVGADPGKVDVFDLRSFRRVGSVEVGQQASGIAFFRMDP